VYKEVNINESDKLAKLGKRTEGNQSDYCEMRIELANRMAKRS